MSNGSSQASRGQIVKPEPAQSRTMASSVAELVNSVVLQQSATKEGYEKIEWVRFEEADLTDLPLKSSLRNLVGSETPLVMVLGLSNGYQAWALMSNGECEEFISVRMGRVKLVKFLSQPEPGFGQHNDAFGGSRPLMITCDSTSAGRPFCSLNVLSLKTGDMVHSLRYDEPVGDMLCNKRVLAVSFPNKIVVLDAASITELFYVKVDQPGDKPEAVPMSLGVSWLAYADNKLNSALQTCGGVSVSEANLSYTSQMMNVAKNLGKTVSTLSETVATSFTGAKPQPRAKSSKSGGAQTCENLGVVTVIDVQTFPRTQTSVHASGDVAPAVVAHFVGCLDERVANLQFSPNCAMLLVCGSTGREFNLFSLLPHPSSPLLGAVQHLYLLRRGTTNARVQHARFSADSRWVAVTTANGTTHVFPITPYGGPPSIRTHQAPRLPNKESRFFRSAGLDSLEPSGPPSPPHLSSSPQATRASPISKEAHPSLDAHHLSLSRVVSNPRLPPYPPPTLLYALAKIKQQFGGPLGTLAAPSQDASAPKKHGPSTNANADSQQRIATAFAPLRGLRVLNPAHRHDGLSMVLYVLNVHGELVEYVFTAKAVASPGTKVSSDSPFELVPAPGAQWQIGRQKRNPDLPAPLVGTHPFMMAAETARAFYANSCRAVWRDPTNAMYPEIEEPRSISGNEAWISEVEMVTYSGPHRRLWMGPQFTFKTYLDSQHSASLISPGDKTRRVDRSEPMAVPGRIPLRSIPVLMEAGSMGSMDHTGGPTVEICGSWSDNDYISCDEHEGKLRQTIADAMRDQPLTERPEDESNISLNHSPSRDSQLQFAAD